MIPLSEKNADFIQIIRKNVNRIKKIELTGNIFDKKFESQRLTDLLIKLIIFQKLLMMINHPYFEILC